MPNVLQKFLRPLQRQSVTDRDIDEAIKSGLVTPEEGEGLRGTDTSRVYEYLENYASGLKPRGEPLPPTTDKTSDAYLKEILAGTGDQSRFGPQRRPGAITKSMEDPSISMDASGVLRDTGSMPATTGGPTPGPNMLTQPVSLPQTPMDKGGRFSTERTRAMAQGKYQLPTSPVEGPVPSPEELAALTQKFDPRTPYEGTVPIPPSRREQMVPLGEMPGKAAPPVMDRYDVIGPQADELQRGETKRMIQGIASALARGGAEMGKARSAGEFYLGSGPRQVDTSYLDKLDEQRMAEAEADKTKVEEAKEVENPFVREAQKLYPDANIKSIADAKRVIGLKETQAKLAESGEAIEASRFKRGATPEGKAAMGAEALEKEGFTSMQQLKEYASGKLSAAPPEIKKMILSERQKWKSNTITTGMEKALDAANKIDALLDAENSTASRAAVTHMVKVAGDTGRLSDQDIARFEQRMGIKGWGDWLHKMAFSDLSDAQKKEFRSIAGEVREMAMEGIQESALKYTKGISQLYPELKPEELATVFLGQELGATTEKKEKKVPEGKREVIVITPFGDNIPGDKIIIDEGDYQEGAGKLWE